MKAPLFLAQAAAPYLEKTQGNIINMIDIHGQRPMKGHPVYCAAKAGLAMLTMSLAKELGTRDSGEWCCAWRDIMACQ